MMTASARSWRFYNLDTHPGGDGALVEVAADTVLWICESNGRLLLNLIPHTSNDLSLLTVDNSSQTATQCITIVSRQRHFCVSLDLRRFS